MVLPFLFVVIQDADALNAIDQIAVSIEVAKSSTKRSAVFLPAACAALLRFFRWALLVTSDGGKSRRCILSTRNLAMQVSVRSPRRVRVLRQAGLFSSRVLRKGSIHQCGLVL